MKPTTSPLHILSIIFLGVFLFGCAEKELKVMTWNIWHGGLHGDKANGFEKDTANIVNVLKVIQQHEPDVLLMQETYCCGMGIAKEAGYEYSWRGSSNLSIHSKFPIVDTVHLFKPFNSHGAVIDVNGEKILFLNIWLHYLPDYFKDIKKYTTDSLVQGESATRLAEMADILSELNKLEIEDMPIVIGGDFNSGSHLDWMENTRAFHYDKIVEWPVSKLIEENGFSDSYRKANPDPLTTMDGTWGFLNDEIISDRIDFIYYKSDRLKTINSIIVKDDPMGGFFNSDHRAVLTVFGMVKEMSESI